MDPVWHPRRQCHRRVASRPHHRLDCSVSSSFFSPLSSRDLLTPHAHGSYDSNGEGDVWVKVAEEAWSTATNDWAVQRMIQNKSRNTVTLPSTLASGKYLMRFDLLALHSANAAPPNGAQVRISHVLSRLPRHG